MIRRVAWAFAILLAPTLVQAQTGSEKYLPSGSQLFWQWDGFGAHNDAIAKTAYGKTMAGDTGTFLSAAYTYVRQSLQVVKQHVDPAIVDGIRDALDVTGDLLKNGFAFGVEATSIQPPQVQAVLVLHQLGGEKSKFRSLIGRAKDVAGGLVEEEKVGARKIQFIDSAVQAGWWSEGDDFLFVVGTEKAVDYAKRIDAKKVGLSKHPLFEAANKNPGFVTWSRGYLDAAALVKLGADVSADMSTLMDDLGLKGIKSVVGYSGFDGLAFRSVIEADLPGPRKGIAGLVASGRKIKLEELPPLPSDLSSFSAMSFSPSKGYSAVLDSIGAFTKMFLGQENFARDMVQQIEILAGVKFGDDLIGSFDDLFVRYSAPSDVLGLGSVMAMKVKDEKKLHAALEAVAKAIPQLPNVGETSIKKRKYRGVDIVELHMHKEGNYKLLSFAIHKGWFVFADYPQPIKGFILRAEGELPTWKMSDDIKKALAPFPKEFSSISVDDPRPGVEMILSLIPALIELGNGFVERVEGLKPFDGGLVPHAQEATRFLFPSVTVTTDDGRKIRTESRSSLP